MAGYLNGEPAKLEVSTGIGLTSVLPGSVQAFGLPTEVPADWPADALVAVMRRDKKAEAGDLRFVLPSRLGHVETVAGVTAGQAAAALR